MNVVTSVCIPVPVFQRWRKYQAKQSDTPALSPVLTKLLDEYLQEREGVDQN